jgi:hypothetical protein
LFGRPEIKVIKKEVSTTATKTISITRNEIKKLKKDLENKL